MPGLGETCFRKVESSPYVKGERDNEAEAIYEGVEDEAVRLVETSGRTKRQIADDLGVGLSTLTLDKPEPRSHARYGGYRRYE
jgi:hypothetical protein